jgi:CheY-like chemotaxis protein
MRVLIVEDDVHVRQLLRELVDELQEGERDRTGQWEVVECADGVEAVAACRRSKPDLVLMDIRMPRMDGIEATKQITSMDHSVRVYIVTQFSDDRFRRRARNAGAAGYFLKDDLLGLQNYLRSSLGAASLN